MNRATRVRARCPRDNEVSALIYYKVHYKQLFIVSACLLIRPVDRAGYCTCIHEPGLKSKCDSAALVHYGYKLPIS